MTKANAESKVSVCTHDRIRHETKRLTVCVVCGVQMERYKGDWRAKTEDREVERERHSRHTA